MISKYHIITLLFILLTSLLLTCQDETPTPDMNNEMVFFNGSIYTVSLTQPWAEAVYVKDGIIEFVGSEEEAKNRASQNASLIDLEGGFMMPGIHDVHLHPLEAATENFQFILDDNVQDPEAYAEDVATAMQQNPGDGWLLGWGHWIDVPLDATRPPKAILDEVAPDRPVAIMEQTSHSIWCNSKALELMDV